MCSERRSPRWQEHHASSQIVKWKTTLDNCACSRYVFNHCDPSNSADNTVFFPLFFGFNTKPSRDRKHEKNEKYVTEVFGKMNESRQKAREKNEKYVTEVFEKNEQTEKRSAVLVRLIQIAIDSAMLPDQEEPTCRQSALQLETWARRGQKLRLQKSLSMIQTCGASKVGWKMRRVSDRK